MTINLPLTPKLTTAQMTVACDYNIPKLGTLKAGIGN